MKGCKYKELVGCKECKYVFHKQCLMFIKMYNTSLIKEIRPFKYKSPNIEFGLSIYAGKGNELLSAAACYAILRRIKIKKFNSNQVLDLMINNRQALEDLNVVPVINIESLKGEVGEKKLQTISSFCDLFLYRGISVFINISSVIHLKEMNFIKV